MLLKPVIPILLLLSILCGASGASAFQAQEIVVNSPVSGEIKSVSVGSTLFERSRIYRVKSTETTVTQTMKGGRWLLPLTIEPSEPLTQVTSNSKFKACTLAGGGPCGLDDDGDGRFDRMAQDSASMALKLKGPIPYQTRTIERVVDDPKAFKQLLLYAGATTDTLRISYREFAGDMARPAFTEDLTIPLTKSFPQLIAVKDLRLRLHGIDGLGLRYEIVGD